jgi:UDP-N-acetylmuramoyl-tripeptide--D-alanyl-D-alanine ligase
MTQPSPPKPFASMPDTQPLWTSAEIEAATGGRLSGPAFEATGITYNSREIVPGDLFLALKGARDGHEFAASAFAAGAAGAITEHAGRGRPLGRHRRHPEARWKRLGVASRDRAPQVGAARSPARSARPA